MKHITFWLGIAGLLIATGCHQFGTKSASEKVDVLDRRPGEGFDQEIAEHSRTLFEEGQHIFRHDTFGSEDFWGGELRLHEAIAGQENGGVGPGLTAKQALEAGLKVDIERLPEVVIEALKNGTVNLDKARTTLELLKANAVVGVTAFFDDPKDKSRMTGVGIQCSLCHSTVDDSFGRGIGRRLDGWPNRDLDIGAIVALAPTLKPFEDLLGADDATVRKVLRSWGPGKYDAEIDKDGKAARPDGQSGATLIPAAFGLAGVNLHTYAGWGSVPYWNAYVAITQMHGKGTFYDPRLNDPQRFPASTRAGLWNIRSKPDLVSSKLAALHYYQLSIPAPEPPPDTYNAMAANRGRSVFEGKAKCSTCHARPSSPSRAGPCTRRRRSGSMISRRAARPTGATIARRRSAASSRAGRAASTTMGGSRRSMRSSTTTRRSSGSN